MVILTVFGARPEAIKMCPVIKELKKRKNIKTVVCVTGQHKQMLDPVLEAFKIKPDYNLSIMKKGQSLFDITVNILTLIKDVLVKEKPDAVLVHGDTSSSFSAALASFYLQIPVAHVEAGLRTYNMDSPYPEEFNRQATDLISRLYFAPTQWAKNNLLIEGKAPKSIFITGNTVIDALKSAIDPDYRSELLDWAGEDKLVILTAHRRENLRGAMRGIFKAVRRAADERRDIKIIFPVHFNPEIRELAGLYLSGSERIKITEPLDLIDFHNLLYRAALILTDSGGIQEEASYLGKPALVMRDFTERPEGVDQGVLKLSGASYESVYKNFNLLLDDEELRGKMSVPSMVYGDGRASERIVRILEREFGHAENSDLIGRNDFEADNY